MRHLLRTGALVAVAIAIPAVVASATYAIGARSLTPSTRLQVSVTDRTTGRSPTPVRSTPDDHGGTSGEDQGGSGTGSSPGGSGETEDHGGGSNSGSDDGSKSGSGGSGGSGSGGSDDHSGSGNGHGGGDD